VLPLGIEMDELESVLDEEVRQLAGGVLGHPQCPALDRPTEADTGTLLVEGWRVTAGSRAMPGLARIRARHICHLTPFLGSRVFSIPGTG
jgi:hypothetical protein